MVCGLASLLGSDWQHSALVQRAVALWCYINQIIQMIWLIWYSTTESDGGIRQIASGAPALSGDWKILINTKISVHFFAHSKLFVYFRIWTYRIIFSHRYRRVANARASLHSPWSEARALATLRYLCFQLYREFKKIERPIKPFWDFFNLTLQVENGVNAIQKWVPFTPQCSQKRWRLGLRPRPPNSYGASLTRRGKGGANSHLCPGRQKPSVRHW